MTQTDPACGMQVDDILLRTIAYIRARILLHARLQRVSQARPKRHLLKREAPRLYLLIILIVCDEFHEAQNSI